MRLLREKDLNNSNSLEEIKDLMLYRVMLFGSIVGVPIVIYNLFFSFGFDITLLGLINLLLFLPIISVILVYRRIPYIYRARILIDSVTIMAFYNFYIAGYTGAAYMLMLSVISFSTAFLSRREAIVRIIITVLLSTISGILYVKGIWVLKADVADALSNPFSWIVSIAFFAYLSFMFFVAYNIIQSKLTQKIEEQRQNNLQLEETNKKLQELIIKQENHQQELLFAKIKAEESNSLKTEFLHNMSHEVRTPLNGIMGFSRLLKREDLSEEKRIQFADIIINSGEKLQHVIDDILEISFLETNQISIDLKNFNVYEFLQELYLVFSVNSRKEIDIRLVKTDKNLYIKSDPHKLHKIMSNLIENALKFTEKGFVEFGCCQTDENIACFYVKDSGIGISKENLEKIFDRFAQEHINIAAKYGGLGLGLCIAKENTELLGGTIRVESEKGVGTTFIVEIPIPETEVDNL